MIKKLIRTTAVALVLAAASALAADPPYRKEPPVYMPPPPVMTWTGFYAGLNAGYSWDNSPNVYTAGAAGSTGLDNFVICCSGYYYNNYYKGLSYSGASALSATGLANTNGSGLIGGGQVGYNYQWGSNLVVGIEADIQGAGIRDRGSFLGAMSTTASYNYNFAPYYQYNYTGNVATSVENEKTVHWLSTVRGRLGYLAMPTLLVYATGGLVDGGVTAHTDIFQGWSGSHDSIGSLLQSSGSVGHFSDTRVGWTVGGGLEWMFVPNWSLKAEYLYYDLGTVHYANSPLTTSYTAYNGCCSNTVLLHSRTKFDGHIVRTGVNYHFNWGAPAPVVASY